MNGTDYRLTDEDEDRMRAALRRTVAEWSTHKRSVNYRDGATLDSLERIAAHAIGCTLADLRDCERQWLANEIGEMALGIAS